VVPVTLSVRRDIYGEKAPFAHHLQGEPPSSGSRTFSKPKHPGRTGRSDRPDPSRRSALTHDRGLKEINNGGHTLEIGYDTVSSGEHAIDYLGSFDATNCATSAGSPPKLITGFDPAKNAA